MPRRALRPWIASLILAAGLVAVPQDVTAHGGGLNAQGCHNDRKRGGYHCHRAPSVGGARTSPKAMMTSGQAFPNCAAARAAGAAPVRRGEPGYGRHLDRDNDGVACESGGGRAGGPLRSGLGAVGLALPFAGSGSPEPFPSRDPTPASPTSRRGPDVALDGLQASERSSIVARLQRVLAQEGYGAGAADGRIGPQTRAALARFQTEMGLPSTGHLDPATLDALGVANEGAEPMEAPVLATGQVFVEPVWLTRPNDLDLARQYPERAQRTGAAGDAVIACVLAASGALQACEILSETPANQGFGEAALRLARYYQAKMAPGQTGRRVQLPMVFTLPN